LTRDLKGKNGPHAVPEKGERPVKVWEETVYQSRNQGLELRARRLSKSAAASWKLNRTDFNKTWQAVGPTMEDRGSTTGIRKTK
jgi:hypothetical protein